MKDFTEQSWKKPFDQLRHDYGLGRDSIGVFAINLKFGLDDFQSIASDAITGGGDDKKCDVLYVDKEKQIAVVAQCYLAEVVKISAPSNKASDLNPAITWLLNTDIDHLPNGLKGRAVELRSAISEGAVRQLHIWYVHNCPGSQNVRDELIGVEATAKNSLQCLDGGNEVAVFSDEVCCETLEKLYTQAERTIIVTDHLETFVPDAFELVSDDWKTATTVVSGEWLVDLYRKYQTDLFSANLRSYLGSRKSDSNINNGIKKTAVSEPDNFYIYNNGITAVVLDYNIGKKGRKGRKLTVHGMSIVNGAQTTGSISSLDGEISKEINVPIRFVKAEKEVIVSSVVQFNNTQNKVQAADFRSNDQIQERLRSEFVAIPSAEYEGGRRGGASDVIKRSKYSLPSYTVGQTLAAFHGDPVTAYDKKSEIWINERIYRTYFTERTTARHICFCYSLLSLINMKKISLTKKSKVEELTNVEREELSFLTKKGAPYLLLHAAAQCMDTILGKAVPNKSDLQFKDNLSPAMGAEVWEEVLELLLSLSGQLDDSFSKGRIRNDSLDKTISNFVGVINSLKRIHRLTFEKFSERVEVAHR